MKYHLALLLMVLSFGVWSGIAPIDTRLTWVLETAPVMLALPVLLTYKRFPLTHLTYTLIAVHTLILMLGAHTLMPKCRWAFGCRLVRLDP